MIKSIITISLLLIGMIWMNGCKKEERKCWDCGINYPGAVPITDTLCDKTEEEIDQWMTEILKKSMDNRTVVWCDPL